MQEIFNQQNNGNVKYNVKNLLLEDLTEYKSYI